MGIFKRLFGVSEWDRLPPRFTQLLIRTLGENDFKIMDGLAKKNNIYRQNIFKDRKIYEDEPEYAMELFGGFIGSMGNHLAQQANYEDAEKALLISLKLKPRENPYRGSLAVIYSQTGRRQEARHEAQQALITMENLERLMANVPIPAEIAPKGPEEGKQEYKDLLINIIEAAENANNEDELKLGGAESYNNAGVNFGEQGRFEEAISAFREAIRLKPGLAEVHYNLGCALGKQGKVEEAIAAYREAVRLKPDYAEVYINLGVSLGKLGKAEEEIAAYLKAIEIKPDDGEAHNNLGNALGEQGRFEEAISAFREAIHLKPDDASAHNNLGVALRQKGETEEAIKEYREAIRLKPDLAKALVNLALALDKEGRREEARGYWERTLKMTMDPAEVGLINKRLAEPR